MAQHKQTCKKMFSCSELESTACLLSSWFYIYKEFALMWVLLKFLLACGVWICAGNVTCTTSWLVFMFRLYSFKVTLRQLVWFGLVPHLGGLLYFLVERLSKNHPELCFVFLGVWKWAQWGGDRAWKEEAAGTGLWSAGTAEVPLPLMASPKADLYDCMFLLAISEVWSKKRRKVWTSHFRGCHQHFWTMMNHSSQCESIMGIFQMSY